MSITISASLDSCHVQASGTPDIPQLKLYFFRKTSTIRRNRSSSISNKTIALKFGCCYNDALLIAILYDSRHFEPGTPSQHLIILSEHHINVFWSRYASVWLYLDWVQQEDPYFSWSQLKRFRCLVVLCALFCRKRRYFLIIYSPKYIHVLQNSQVFI